MLCSWFLNQFFQGFDMFFEFCATQLCGAVTGIWFPSYETFFHQNIFSLFQRLDVACKIAIGNIQ